MAHRFEIRKNKAGEFVAYLRPERDRFDPQERAGRPGGGQERGLSNSVPG